MTVPGSARDETLAKIRLALTDVPLDEPASWTEDTGRPASAHDHQALVALAAARIADYQATVTRIAGPGMLADTLAAVLSRHGVRTLAVAGDLPHALRPGSVDVKVDAPLLTNDELSAVDGVLTLCTTVIAETGTIVLDGGIGQGRRALTLLPDLHVCVIEAAQVVADVPDAVKALVNTSRPMTFISGPSATSDIELERVEGVHGPRSLEVILIG